MNSTTDFFASTKGLPVKTSPGRLTAAQVFALCDGMTGIYVTCSRVLQSTGWETSQFAARLETLRKSSEMTVPQMQRVFALWSRWTFHPSQLVDGVPCLSSVTQFLYSL